jgi:hypothetical protein
MTLSEKRRIAGRKGGLTTAARCPRDSDYMKWLNIKSQQARGIEPLAEYKERIRKEAEGEVPKELRIPLYRKN